MSSLPTLAITIGDPAGIGPEIIVKALAASEVRAVCRPVVYGPVRAIEQAVRELRSDQTTKLLGRPEEAVGDEHVICIVEEGIPTRFDWPRAAVSADAGRIAYAALDQAARAALEGAVGAIVTAPLNKEGLSRAGWPGIGHTELLARFCGVAEDDVAMLLASDTLRVAHVSTHVSLRKAIDLVTRERVKTTARLCGEATRELVGRPPRIAVAGLNPHAGEHGLFGTEEIEEIEPAIRDLAGEGWNVAGPVPPDTVFLRAAKGEFDCVIAMYHDQGHIPSKLGGFVDTVNITLGLPIIRTSVDHGTAYDIVGKGMADARNLVHAIQLAASMAGNRERRDARSQAFQGDC